MKKIFLLTAIFFCRIFAFADEGMWIPLFLGYNEVEMQQMGFRLTADDVYSVNHHSMKDGIVLFGGGCTGELISPDGLLVTNHHCGYSYVQSHSTLEHNYLHNGFWSRSRDEEIACKGLSVTFLVRMEDVTAAALKGVTASMTEEERSNQIATNIKAIKSSATEGTHYEAVVKPFFYGNQYFLFVNEVFKDIRLVGVPPEDIGKFGGDTDNWMWPRHTGDFSLWRVYTSPDGKPAEYSENNIPLKSKKFFTISSKGVKENDFTLVFGYPGTTQQFLISDAVDIIANVQDPIAIHARDLRLAAMKRQMDKSVATRLMYSAKANSISNGWKKWQGEIKGINECNVLEKKKLEEFDFLNWTRTTQQRQDQYGLLLRQMKDVYADYRNMVKTDTYLGETFIGTEIIVFLYSKVLPVINTAANADIDDATFNAKRDKLVQQAEAFFQNYNSDIDAECFTELMYYYFSTQDPNLVPQELLHYVNAPKESWQAMYAKAGNKSPYFTNGDKFVNFVKNAKRKDFVKMRDNEIFKLMLPAFNQYFENYNKLSETRKKLDLLYRQYVKGLMEKESDKTFYPDANLTMRVTYGQVKGFQPKDGVDYVYYTTIDGIMEKENPDIFDYKVEPRLKELYQKKDYGRYANEKGELPVCFIASNHTTGGNSGSPVINADGELIGINFDRVWEGTMSDINYDVDRCRNISLDVRYFLFIVDKFANAQNLINEMTID